MNITEAIQCCWKVIGRVNNVETEEQCMAWLETLRIMKELGFEYVSIEGTYTPKEIEW